MKWFGYGVKALSNFMYSIACFAIVIIVFLTVTDVVLRRLGAPIDFALEVVCILAGIVIAFALPHTSLVSYHVMMELIQNRLPPQWMKVVHVFTRCIGIGFFAVTGWYVFQLGNRLREAGQHSAVLELPEFPMAYGLGVCCFVECLVLFYTLFQRPPEKSP